MDHWSSACSQPQPNQSIKLSNTCGSLDCYWLWDQPLLLCLFAMPFCNGKYYIARKSSYLTLWRCSEVALFTWLLIVRCLQCSSVIKKMFRMHFCKRTKNALQETQVMLSWAQLGDANCEIAFFSWLWIVRFTQCRFVKYLQKYKNKSYSLFSFVQSKKYSEILKK